MQPVERTAAAIVHVDEPRATGGERETVRRTCIHLGRERREPVQG